MASRFSKTEQEVIVLKAIWEMIDEMVNYEMFVKRIGTDEVALLFNSRTCQRLFHVLVVDFLSQPKNWPFELEIPPHDALKSEKNLLFHLKQICEAPKLNPVGGGGLARRPRPPACRPREYPLLPWLCCGSPWKWPRPEALTGESRSRSHSACQATPSSAGW